MSDDTNNDSLNDVRKAPESKPAGEKAKKAADKGKKAVKAVKKLKNMGKLGTVGLFIAAIIIIIFIAIGIYGFITTLPGLASEKIVETAKHFWKWLTVDDTIEVDPAELNELANYLESMGYNIVGYGFAQSGRYSTNGTDGANIAENDDKSITNVRSSNIYAYVLANERTYTLVGTSNGEISYGIIDVIFFGPIRRSIKSISNLFNQDKRYREGANYGMLRFEDSFFDNVKKTIDGFKLTMDRESNQLVVDVGRLSVDRMTYDLSGWTSLYGKPIELSLALHLSTMAPDFVYDFCMDSDLQTVVNLATEKVTYKNMQYKYLKEGAKRVATQEKVKQVAEEIEDAEMPLEEFYRLFPDETQLTIYNNDGVTLPSLPVDILFDANTVCVVKRRWYNIIL